MLARSQVHKKNWISLFAKSYFLFCDFVLSIFHILKGILLSKTINQSTRLIATNLWGLFYQRGFISISAWIINNLPTKAWDENTYPFPNFNDANRWSLGIDKWFHSTLYDGWNHLSIPGLKLIHVSKRGPVGFVLWSSGIFRSCQLNTFLAHCTLIIPMSWCRSHQ